MDLMQTCERILATAERRYGPRCEGWTFDGIRFHDGPPCLHFADSSTVAIYLGGECQSSEKEAVYQLGHEVIHLLAPVRKSTTVLEEGIATDFAVAHLLDERCESFLPVWTPYHAAMYVYQRLERLDYHIVKKMRAEQPVISRIDADLIRRHCPKCDQATAHQLTERFTL